MKMITLILQDSNPVPKNAVIRQSDGIDDDTDVSSENRTNQIRNQKHHQNGGVKRCDRD